MALKQDKLGFELEKMIKVNKNDMNYFNALEQLHEVRKRSKANKGPVRDIEMEQLLKVKTPLYRVEQYDEKELIELQRTIIQSAGAIGGLPQGHKQVFEKKGWLTPFLLGYDGLTTGRWNYWTDIMMKGTLEGSGPIPQIEWSRDVAAIHQVKKMLYKCMDGVASEGATAMDFADWLMWGLAATNEKPKISDKVNEYWYRNFDLALVLLYPTDYMSALLEDVTSKGYKDSLGYFSTPPSVTQLMTTMVAMGDDPEDMKMKSVLDSCVGCGAMLLPMSNYCLFAAGQDINPVAVKFSIIQMYWYAPWYAINPFDKP